MTTTRERLIDLVNEIPEAEIEEVLYYLDYIKRKQGIDSGKKASEINIDYWDSDIDDEVWKEV